MHIVYILQMLKTCVPHYHTSVWCSEPVTTWWNKNIAQYLVAQYWIMHYC